MTDLGQIFELWQDLRSSSTEYVLATVVVVEGSGYRKPGARMIIASDGRRRGTISGGCLEGEVARKAFWHTENGPVVRRYSTSADDGDVPFGMGCGGVVHLLLERSSTADPALERLAQAYEQRKPLAIATVLEGEWIGRRAYHPSLAPKIQATENSAESGRLDHELASVAEDSFEQERSFTHTILSDDGVVAAVRAEWNSARPGLFVFGAGDDALPVVRLAHQLGWYVAVADGRSNLATRVRFPEADDVFLLTEDQSIVPKILPSDAAALMTHSLEQDTNALRDLLPISLAYIGVLGPRRRTAEILTTLALEITTDEIEIDGIVERWMEQIHAPMGLDLGGETPADIALAILSEIQQVIRHGSGLSLRSVRRTRHLREVERMERDTY